MAGDDDDYVYDEDSGEWLPAGELAAKRAADGAVEVRDAVGNLLADGDSVTLIKDLTVKGAGQTLKQGTVIKSIRLTGDAQEIDCRFDGIKGLVLRARRRRLAAGPDHPDRRGRQGQRRAAGPARQGARHGEVVAGDRPGRHIADQDDPVAQLRHRWETSPPRLDRGARRWQKRGQPDQHRAGRR
jgi:protein PhnA